MADNQFTLDGLTDSQKMALVRRKFAQNAEDAELALLIHMAKKYDLDILTGQIYLIKYRNKQTGGWHPAQIFCSRDGFLHIAQRSKNFDGMHTEFREEKGDLIACTTVWSKAMTHPIKVEVYLSEFTTNLGLWKTKKRVMLQKVGESHALRRCFDISGLYDSAEFDQGVNGSGPQEKEITPPPVKASITKTEPPKPQPTKTNAWETNAEVPEVFIIPFRQLGCKKLREVNKIAAEANWEFVAVQKLLLKKLYKFTGEDHAVFFNVCNGFDWDDGKISDYLAKQAIKAEGGK